MNETKMKDNFYVLKTRTIQYTSSYGMERGIVAQWIGHWTSDPGTVSSSLTGVILFVNKNIF